MKTIMKRIILMVLCFVFCLSMLPVTGALAGSEALSGYRLETGATLKADRDGSFRVLQLPDIQDHYPVSARTASTIKLAIAQFNPHLIVLTGDNVTFATSWNNYKKSVDQIVDLFGGIPFAVTYGNHDFEHNYYYGLKTIDGKTFSESESGAYLAALDSYWIKKGAVELMGYSSSLGSVGTGYIDVTDYLGIKIIDRIVIMNSGTFGLCDTEADPSGWTYGRVGGGQFTSVVSKITNESEHYNNVVAAVDKWTSDPSVRVLAFQHIPLREFPRYAELDGKTLNDNSTQTHQFAAEIEYVSAEWTGGSYGQDKSVGRTLLDTKDIYKSLAKPNVAGIFYGHDHSNTCTVKTTVKYDGKNYTLTQGYGGGLLVDVMKYKNDSTKAATNDYSKLSCQSPESYPLNNPILTEYTLNSDGSFINEHKSYFDLCKTADCPSGEDYIGDVALFYGDSFKEACSHAENAGYIPVTTKYESNSVQDVYPDDTSDADLNPSSSLKGVGAKSVVIAYKTTEDPGNAVTDIRIDAGGEKAQHAQTYSYTLPYQPLLPDGTKDIRTATYYKVPTDSSRFITDDANYGAYTTAGNSTGYTPSQTHIYVYYTKSRDMGMPLTGMFLMGNNGGDFVPSRDIAGGKAPNYRAEGFWKNSDVTTDKSTSTETKTNSVLYRFWPNLDRGETGERVYLHLEQYSKAFDYDRSGNETGEEQSPVVCTCNCHKSGFMGFIWKIINFFNRIFKTNPVCECGVKHY